MKINLILFIGYLPYLFLATSITKINDSYRAYFCHIETFGEIKQNVSFGAVSYRPIGLKTMDYDSQIILPYFFTRGEVKYALCAGTKIVLGRVDNLKIGTKIFVETADYEIKLFGYSFNKETSWMSFSTINDRKFKEGETVLIRLVDGKDVEFFDGKRIKK